jgi:hypothetical protein
MGGATGIRTRTHPDKALTAVGIKALKKPGRYADGNGLYLKISRSGAKRWELRTVVRGKRCDIGLGGLKLVSLAEAREEARKYRQVARNDGDPLADRRRSRLVVPTFREAAETVYKDHAKAWKNPKHGDQWINTLKAYAYPAFGDRRVDQVDTTDILKALSPIWLTKPETARRVRQRIGTVLDWAKAVGHRAGSNPVKEISKALPRQSDRKGHHAALPYTEVVCSEASRLQRNYPQPGIRVSDPDRGADQRSAQGEMERDRPGAGGLDDTSQPHEGRQARSTASRWRRAVLSFSSRPSCSLPAASSSSPAAPTRSRYLTWSC